MHVNYIKEIVCKYSTMHVYLGMSKNHTKLLHSTLNKQQYEVSLYTHTEAMVCMYVCMFGCLSTHREQTIKW